MGFADNKTKIVCTIGPASDSPEVIEALIRAGMNIARLNFSHGDFQGHGSVIEKIRAAERVTGRPAGPQDEDRRFRRRTRRAEKRGSFHPHDAIGARNP